MRKYLIIVWIVTMLVSVFVSLFALKQRREIVRLQNNLHARTLQYEDLQGRTVTQSYAYQSTIKELRQASRVDSTLRTDYEKTLAEARNTIRDMKKRLAQVESVNTITVVSTKTDTVLITEGDSIVIEPINTKHWNIDFRVIENRLMIADMSYSAKVDIVVDRERNRKPDGKKRFILCRMLRPNWVYSSSAVCDDPNAEITVNMYMRFDK